MAFAGVFDDILDTKPSTILQVTYNGGINVNVGNELTPTQVKDQPKVDWEADSNALYTLLMIDPDAPSAEDRSLSEVLHWLVINIPGKNIAAGQVVGEYIGSGPPEGSGLHRYMFMVFKQGEKITTDKFIPKDSLEGRFNIKTREYIAKFKLGNPVAANYYRAQFDDYVNILRATFKSGLPK